MTKFAMKNGAIHDRAFAEQVPHAHVPGRAYNVADPVTKLIHKVYERLQAVKETVQLPFRFFSAEREVTSIDAEALLGRMLDRAVEKVADLPGSTLVLTVNSGSAVGCAISGKSKLRVADCGNMLEAILAKKLGRRAIIGVFGDSLIWVKFNQADNLLYSANGRLRRHRIADVSEDD